MEIDGMKAALGLLLVAPCAVASDATLLQNGLFDADVAGWTVVDEFPLLRPGHLSWRPEDASGSTGSGSALLVPADPEFPAIVSQCVVVTPGTTYRAGVEANPEIGITGSVGLSVSFVSACGGPYFGPSLGGASASANLAEAGRWQTLALNVVAPPAAGGAQYALRVSNSNTTLRGASFDNAYLTSRPATVPMYRTYNPNADDHFFTTSLAEFENAVAAGYIDESNPPCCAIPFRVLDTQVEGAAAILRMYNPNNGHHYYTANAAERDALEDLGWVYEKDEGFVYTSLQSGTAEVFRLYNNSSGAHLYTASAAERDAILATFPGIWFQHTSLGFAVP